jgi:hypothetical protein
VPCFFSSEKLRIVTAGIKNNMIQGDNVKKGLKSAKPLCNMLYSPSKTHKKSPLNSKNIAITRYPIGDPKKDLISCSAMDFIIVNLFFFKIQNY